MHQLLKEVEITVGGINQIVSNIKHIKIKLRFNYFKTSLPFFVMPIISNCLSLQEFPSNIVM